MRSCSFKKEVWK